jgi:hypothetical protein
LLADDDIRGEHRAEAVKKTRAFAREHTDLEAIAATNHLENPLNLSKCLYVKLAVTPPPPVYFLDELSSKSASVQLDVQNFQFYKVDPEPKARTTLIQYLRPLNPHST